MATLDIIVKPKLKFSLKRCGDVVPYGITPEEKAKLAGIEENANDYTHPETHPSSILDVVDVVDGAANKFLNERGEMVAVAHESLTDKNSESAFQHVDTTVTKTTLATADMVAVKDSVTGKVVMTPKSNLQTDLTNVNQAITNLQNGKANKAQEAWITPTLLNGWTKAITDPAYMKDEFGFVHLKGRVTGGAIPSTVFTLPVGYRPAQAKYYVLNSDGFRITYCYINDSGYVIINSGATTGASFDQIMFMANS